MRRAENFVLIENIRKRQTFYKKKTRKVFVFTLKI